MLIRAVGIDAAFANMGFARVLVCSETGKITCQDLILASTEAEHQKVVRKSSDRLRRGSELRTAMLAACDGASFAFAEVPSGTQSAAAAFGLGIAVGILAGCPIPIIEVNPMEVKEAVAGKRVKQGASKAEIIEWAEKRWPDAPWRRAKNKVKVKGVVFPAGRLTADNEHLADALASIVAGIQTPEFKRLITLMKASNAIPSPANLRPALDKSTRRRIQVVDF